nr:hypothetical protein Cry52Nrm1_p107 [Cryptomonas curvata]
MCCKTESQFIFIEIPEFEKNGITSPIIFFNIFGINSEKPVIRLDNLLFEGKWYNCNNSLILGMTNKSITKNDSYSPQFFFIGSSFFTNDSTDYNKVKLNNFQLMNVNCIKKSLRLYRIPLLIDCE